MPSLTGVDVRDSIWAIDQAPPNPRREPARAARLLGSTACNLTLVSLATFSLVGAGLLQSDWLAIALGEALVALALLMCSGPSQRSIGAYSRASEEGGEATRIEPLLIPIRGTQLETRPEDQQPPARRPVSGRRSRRGGAVGVTWRRRSRPGVRLVRGPRA